jgi:hypothetical protein
LSGAAECWLLGAVDCLHGAVEWILCCEGTTWGCETQCLVSTVNMIPCKQKVRTEKGRQPLGFKRSKLSAIVDPLKSTCSGINPLVSYCDIWDFSTLRLIYELRHGILYSKNCLKISISETHKRCAQCQKDYNTLYQQRRRMVTRADDKSTTNESEHQYQPVGIEQNYSPNSQAMVKHPQKSSFSIDDNYFPNKYESATFDATLAASLQDYNNIRSSIEVAFVRNDFLQLYNSAIYLIGHHGLSLTTVCAPMTILIESGKVAIWSVCWGFSHRDNLGNLDLEVAKSDIVQDENFPLAISMNIADDSMSDQQVPFFEHPPFFPMISPLLRDAVDFLNATSEVPDSTADRQPAQENSSSVPMLNVDVPNNDACVDINSQLLKRQQPKSNKRHLQDSQNTLELSSESLDVHRVQQFFSVKRHPHCPRFAINLDRRKWWNRNICHYCRFSLNKRVVKSFEDRIKIKSSINYSLLCFDELVHQHDILLNELSKLQHPSTDN